MEEKGEKDFSIDLDISDTEKEIPTKNPPLYFLKNEYRVEYGHPKKSDLKLFFHIDALKKIKKQAIDNKNVEVGGVLLGKVFKYQNIVFIDVKDYIQATKYKNTSVSFTFTQESWNDIHNKMDDKKDLKIVGWYHTHPGHGIFLSGADLYIHNNFFEKYWQVALVVDPLHNTLGILNTRNGKYYLLEGFYIYDTKPNRKEIFYFLQSLGGGSNKMKDNTKEELYKILQKGISVTSKNIVKFDEPKIKLPKFLLKFFGIKGNFDYYSISVKSIIIFLLLLSNIFFGYEFIVLKDKLNQSTVTIQRYENDLKNGKKNLQRGDNFFSARMYKEALMEYEIARSKSKTNERKKIDEKIIDTLENITGYVENTGYNRTYFYRLEDLNQQNLKSSK